MRKKTRIQASPMVIVGNRMWKAMLSPNWARASSRVSSTAATITAMDYREQGWWRDDDTAPHWLRKHALERPSAAAIVSAAGTLTWRELQARVLRVARGLRKKGIGRGDVVAVQLPNTLDFLLAHL